jgi:hypothetical protein
MWWRIRSAMFMLRAMGELALSRRCWADRDFGMLLLLAFGLRLARFKG